MLGGILLPAACTASAVTSSSYTGRQPAWEEPAWDCLRWSIPVPSLLGPGRKALPSQQWHCLIVWETQKTRPSHSLAAGLCRSPPGLTGAWEVSMTSGWGEYPVPGPTWL